MSSFSYCNICSGWNWKLHFIYFPSHDEITIVNLVKRMQQFFGSRNLRVKRDLLHSHTERTCYISKASRPLATPTSHLLIVTLLMTVYLFSTVLFTKLFTCVVVTYKRGGYSKLCCIISENILIFAYCAVVRTT